MCRNNNTVGEFSTTVPTVVSVNETPHSNIKKPYRTSRQQWIELNGNHSVVNMGAIKLVWKIDEEVLKLGVSHIGGGEFFMSYPASEWGDDAEGARDEDFTILTMLGSINIIRKDI